MIKLFSFSKETNQFPAKTLYSKFSYPPHHGSSNSVSSQNKDEFRGIHKEGGKKDLLKEVAGYAKGVNQKSDFKMLVYENQQ